MEPRRRTLALGLAALATTAAGCGGSGSGDETVPAPGAANTSAPAAVSPSTSTATSAGQGKVDLPKPYSDVAGDVQRQLNALGREVPSASGFGTDAFGAACRRLAGDVRRIAATLRAAQPPYPVRAQHSAVLRRLGSMEEDFGALATANDARDPNAASSALSGVSTALAGIQSDIRRIRSTVK